MFSSNSFSPSPTPAMVPPVPAAQVKPSIRPSSCSHSSGAVPSMCALRLAILSNWLAQTAPGVSSARRREVCTKCPGLANLVGGTRTSRSEERRVGKDVSVRVDLGGRRIIKKKRIEHRQAEQTRNHKEEWNGKKKRRRD